MVKLHPGEAYLNQKNTQKNNLMGGRRGDLEGVIGWVISKFLKIGLHPVPIVA